jgi:hypothetical protein
MAHKVEKEWAAATTTTVRVSEVKGVGSTGRITGRVSNPLGFWVTGHESFGFEPLHFNLAHLGPTL